MKKISKKERFQQLADAVYYFLHQAGRHYDAVPSQQALAVNEIEAAMSLVNEALKLAEDK